MKWSRWEKYKLLALFLLVLIVGCLALYWQAGRDTRDRTFRQTALLEKGDKVEKIQVWVRVGHKKDNNDMYTAKSWSYEQPADCVVVDRSEHYKTGYPVTGLTGPGGERAFIVELGSRE